MWARVLCISSVVTRVALWSVLCVAAVVHDIKRMAWNSSGHASCPELERAQSVPHASAQGGRSVATAQCKCFGEFRTDIHMQSRSVDTEGIGLLLSYEEEGLTQVKGATEFY